MMLNPTSATICFSISHVLAVPFKEEIVDSLLGHGVIATANKLQQFIFPGVVELMQLLFETESIKVAFFSSEEERKTKAFVEMLLNYSLGPRRYEEVKCIVKIFSKKDLSVDTLQAYKEQKKQFNFKSNLLTKNLARLSGDAILVDPIPGNIAAGQEQHLFCVPRSRANSFAEISNSSSHLTSIDICFKAVENMRMIKEYRTDILTHKHILLTCCDKRYYLIFAHEKSNELCFYPCSEVESEELKTIALNEGIYSQEKIGKISPYLRVFILSKLTAYHGKVEKIASREVNHIYFIAGAIFEALQVAKDERRPVSEVLFSWQKGFKISIEEFHANERLYHLGLNLLSKKNSKLHFLTKLSDDNEIKVD